MLICLPFALAVLMARFEGFDASLEEASRDLGENGWMTFWRVTFPLVLPGIVSSLLLTFIVSFDDFMIAFFLSGTEATLPVYIWGELRFPAGCRACWRSAPPSWRARSSWSPSRNGCAAAAWRRHDYPAPPRRPPLGAGRAVAGGGGGAGP